MLTTHVNIPPSSSIFLMQGGRGYISSLLWIADINFICVGTTKSHDSSFPIKHVLRHKASIWTTSKFICMYMYLHMYVFVCMWIYMYMHIHVHMHMYMYIVSATPRFECCSHQPEGVSVSPFHSNSLLCASAQWNWNNKYVYRHCRANNRFREWRQVLARRCATSAWQCRYICFSYDCGQHDWHLISRPQFPLYPSDAIWRQRLCWTLAQVTKHTAWRNCKQSCWKHTKMRMVHTPAMLFCMAKLRFCSKLHPSWNTGATLMRQNKMCDGICGLSLRVTPCIIQNTAGQLICYIVELCTRLPALYRVPRNNEINCTCYVYVAYTYMPLRDVQMSIRYS